MNLRNVLKNYRPFITPKMKKTVAICLITGAIITIVLAVMAYLGIEDVTYSYVSFMAYTIVLLTFGLAAMTIMEKQNEHDVIARCPICKDKLHTFDLMNAHCNQVHKTTKGHYITVPFRLYIPGKGERILDVMDPLLEGRHTPHRKTVLTTLGVFLFVLIILLFILTPYLSSVCCFMNVALMILVGIIMVTLFKRAPLGD